jgi:hypothetical protein
MPNDAPETLEAAAPRIARGGAARLFLGRRSLVLQAPAPGGARVIRDLGDGGLAGACAALRALLAESARPPVEVQVASAWSRVLRLPSLAQLTTDERWANFARARFEDLYGQSAEEWDIRVARDLPGRDRVAVAVPAALLRALGHEPGTRGRARSARVALLEHLQALLRREPRFTGCVAEIDAGGAGLLLLVDGTLQRARWCRFGDERALVAAARAEWVNVQAAAPGAAKGAALALAPMPGVPESDSLTTAAALAAGLGFRRSFPLARWV